MTVEADIPGQVTDVEILCLPADATRGDLYQWRSQCGADPFTGI
jgi:hypothetical protein